MRGRRSSRFIIVIDGDVNHRAEEKKKIMAIASSPPASFSLRLQVNRLGAEERLALKSVAGSISLKELREKHLPKDANDPTKRLRFFHIGRHLDDERLTLDQLYAKLPKGLTDEDDGGSAGAEKELLLHVFIVWDLRYFFFVHHSPSEKVFWLRLLCRGHEEASSGPSDHENTPGCFRPQRFLSSIPYITPAPAGSRAGAGGARGRGGTATAVQGGREVIVRVGDSFDDGSARNATGTRGEEFSALSSHRNATPAQSFLRGLFGWRPLVEEQDQQNAAGRGQQEHHGGAGPHAGTGGGPPRSVLTGQEVDLEAGGAAGNISIGAPTSGTTSTGPGRGRSAINTVEISAQDAAQPSAEQIAQQEAILRALEAQRDLALALRGRLQMAQQAFSAQTRSGGGDGNNNQLQEGGTGPHLHAPHQQGPLVDGPTMFGRGLFAGAAPGAGNDPNQPGGPRPLGGPGLAGFLPAFQGPLPDDQIPQACREGRHPVMHTIWPTLPGVLCACLCFPYGVFCCLFHKMRRCPYCGTVVHSC